MKTGWLLLAAIALVSTMAFGTERRQIVAAGGVKPIGPYSPGILAGDYLYVSGQGALDAAGKMPATFEAQARLTLDNVKGIVEAAGLTLAHVVYSQAYLTDMGNYDAFDRIWREYFPKDPPARAVLGMARMPVGTPVEVNAVAVRDLSRKRTVPGGVLAGDRMYISGVFGSTAAEALDKFGDALRSGGLEFGHLVFVNPYLTARVSTEEMNRVYAPRFEAGNTPARATIAVNSLPQGAAVEFTGVAVRDPGQRQAVRPKNMPPSATASPCVWAGDTLYCSAKAGFIPGPNGGIYADTVETQVRQTMRNLLDGLEEAGLTFANVVASNVYLDNIDEFARMNRIYALYFPGMAPTRTTVQPAPPVERRAGAEGRWPKLEEISIIAVK